jgi:quinone-modifying oxidoreductase subunit QmoC
VLAAIRQESIIHFSVPHFLGRGVSQPAYIPLLLGIPAALLGAALLLREPLQNLLGIPAYTGEPIVYSYSATIPHWLLNGFFFFFAILVFIAVVIGIGRFWRALQAAAAREGVGAPVKGLVPSIIAVLKRVATHQVFAVCKARHARYLSHRCVLYGFLALLVVTIWVITARSNPLVRSEFVYPFSFWSPWKILANLGGLLLVFGCFVMINDRVTDSELGNAKNFYFDWTFLVTLLVVAVTGFATEVLHYLRLEPHRHVIYFVHLVFAFVLLVYLPYSKFAHMIYRTTALVFAEYTGRNLRVVTGRQE